LHLIYSVSLESILRRLQNKFKYDNFNSSSKYAIIVDISYKDMCINILRTNL